MADNPTSTTAVSATASPISPVQFRISEDSMRAYMDLATGPPDAKLGMEDFYRIWQSQGLDKSLLNIERLMEAGDEWNRTHLSKREILVAESVRYPVPGISGRLEFLIDLTPESKPQESGVEQERIDHRKVHAVRVVEKGQPLVRRHPPERGRAGLNLHGKEVPAVEGKEVAFPDTDLIVVAPNDANLLVASVTGFIEWDKSRLCVRDCFVVNGSVDYASGNIEYERSVLVKGDIQDGFTVRAGGNLEVAGLIGDAQVTVVGNVVVLGGFVGTGQGKLNTQGDLQVGFVSNQSVRAYGNIVVAKESFNGRLLTKGALVVNGPLVGGIALAGLRVECKVLGNDMGTRTELEIGVDYLDLENRMELDKKIRELNAALQKMRLRMGKVKEVFQRTRKLLAADAKLLFDLRGKVDAITEILPTLEARKTELEERIRQGYFRKGIELKVEGKIYPGVVIKIENQSMRIPEVISGPRYFNYFEERIHMF